MTGTDDNRRRIEELLPFYLNGTLDDAERAEVEAALATDESLRW
ncbi:MAG: zf-HC2 domain-containing protein, partial [Silicimonas sp.]|nr:zf-HC2 domain-containing protein [Silicimonas sp.]